MRTLYWGPVFVAALVCAVIISDSAFATQASCPNISDCAYQELNQRAAANSSSFYVFRDADSAFNHGFASGLFFSKDITPSSIVIDPACVDSAGSATGCATDPNVFDQGRGTVLRISFPAFASATFAGLNFQDPENYAPGDGSLGYNLLSASAVQFDVRAPGGAVVQFGVGGCVTGFFQVGPAWQTLTIALNTLHPAPGGGNSCPPDLSNAHILFTIATNGAQQSGPTTILLDNIQFTPVPARQTADPRALSLPISTQTFGVIPAMPMPLPDQANRNVAAVYESALTVLALLKRGQPSDVTNAFKITDALDYALHHENHGDPIPQGSDGSIGLHNGYMAGDIALLNGQSGQGAQAGDVRLAGFTGDLTCGPTRFCLVLDGATGGNNAWAMFAFLSAYLANGKGAYLTDAETIGRWIVDRLTDPTNPSTNPPSYGGYFLGFADMGTHSLIQGKSTENNADIFGAFSLVSQIESAKGNAAAAAQWQLWANVAGDFVLQMFDQSLGRFYTGTVTVNPPSPPASGNCQTNPPTQLGNDIINVCDFLDSNSFTVLPMAASARYRNSIDWKLPAQYILNHFAQSITVGAVPFNGYDIIPNTVSGSNGIAWEFTGQAAVTFQLIDSIDPQAHFQSQINSILSEIAHAQAAAPFSDGLGLPASTLQDGNTLPPGQQCLNTPFQCIPERVGIAATAWAILADQQFNPMAPPGALFTPFSMTFGTQTTNTRSSPIGATLTSVGSTALVIGQISLSGANPGDFSVTSDCIAKSPLAPGVTCTLNITFQPAAAGARTAFVSVVSNGMKQQLPLSGQGDPVNDFSMLAIPTGQVVHAGGTTSYTLQTFVTKGAPQSISLSVSGLPAGVTASFGKNSINSGESTQLTISAAITAILGVFQFNVVGTAAETIQVIMPVVTVQALFAASLQALTFGSQNIGTAGTPQDVVITNTYSGPISLVVQFGGTDSGFDGPADFYETDDCPAQLASQASCTISARFQPTGTGPRSAQLRIVSTGTQPLLIPVSGIGAGTCPTVSACVYSLLNQRVSQASSTFYVYKDADSALNHGIPSGVFTFPGLDPSSVTIDGGCVDDATSLTGCSTDPAAIDMGRGTVLSVTFTTMAFPQFAGVNIVEPSDFSPFVTSTGYDLTPVTDLILDARAPSGANVRFGIGGCVTPFYTLQAYWTGIIISLSSLRQPGGSGPCTPDLSKVHILFAISADSLLGSGFQPAARRTILLDNVAFIQIPSRQSNVVSLPLSTTTFGVAQQQNYPIPTDQVNRNLATTYESSLAVLALLGRGKAQDISSAVKVANALDYALHHDNQGDPVPVLNGASALHSSYEAGELPFLNPQAAGVGNAQAGQVRLSGFSASADLCGTTQFCLVLDGANGGNNAWAILALTVAFEYTGKTSYLTDAEMIGNWIGGLVDNTGTGFGGYYLGYSDGGTPKQLQLGKSTEQNADIFAAFNLLSRIESLIGNTSQAALWAGRAQIAGDFVIRMFDSANGRFNTGTVNNIFTTGPSPGICPSATQTQGTDTINGCDFIDANTAAILAMSATPGYRNAIDWTRPARYLASFSQTVNGAGNTYQGFELTTAPAGTGIGWEFTAQAVAVYETGLLTNGSVLASNYLQQLNHAQNSAPFGDGLGVVGSTLQNGEIKAPAIQCLNTPFQCIPERVGLAASSWAALVDQNVNPMVPRVTPIVTSAPSVEFQPQQLGAIGSSQTLLLTNSWAVSVTLTLTITGTNASDFSISGCTAMLAAGASCTLTITFTPSAPGPRSAGLSISQMAAWATVPTTSTVGLAGSGARKRPGQITSQ